MDINEVQTIIADAEKKIVNLKEMIDDYNACKNETAKSVLLAAISKYAGFLKLQQTIR